MLISICIPTYNSGEKLERLLDSIENQVFTDYEVVISDDSNNDSVKRIIDEKYPHMTIRYFHNQMPLGTPGNWNNAVDKGKGEWIKIMHHDDWFYSDQSLLNFAEETKKSNQSKLLFCAFQNCYHDIGTKDNFHCSSFEILLLRLNYLNLFKTFMGNPSCTLIHSACKPYSYDKTFKWLIDFDFYTTFLKKYKSFTYIDKILINVGMHKGQVTASVFQNPLVEIPESISILNKHGANVLENIFVYDFYWRLYRNLNIRGLEQFNSYLGSECRYAQIISMINTQSKYRVKTLKIGVLSKLLMFFSYLKNYISRH
jgi:glycosyltransferase involved in cell wall biosynthesis